MKRLFDLTAAIIGLALLLPVFLLVGLIVKVDSPGPALYGQERVGRHGRPFTIWKFRTMRHGGGGQPLTVGDDGRITRTGRWLRKYRLDELPQLFNVLRGQMSLVGPRPEVPRYVAHYPADLRKIVLSVRPGITDRAAIAFRNEAELLATSKDPEAAYLRDVLPQKLRMHADYVRDRTFMGDLAIIFETLASVVFRNRG